MPIGPSTAQANDTATTTPSAGDSRGRTSPGARPRQGRHASASTVASASPCATSSAIFSGVGVDS